MGTGKSERLIKGLRKQIRECEDYGIKPDEVSWKYQSGVILSCNDAEFIIEALKQKANDNGKV
nr:hypothetical protein 46 [Balneolaceae bacterium]